MPTNGGPPPGYVAPPPGTAAPPPGYVGPTSGTAGPPPVNVGPPPGTAAPPPGYVGPTPGYVGPTPGYGQPWPPAGYGQPWPLPQPPRRRGGSFLTAMTIVFGVLAALSLFLSLLIGHDASTCNSGIGEFAQAFDQQAASQCSTVNAAHAALEVVTVVLGVACIGFLAATIDRFRR